MQTPHIQLPVAPPAQLQYYRWVETAASWDNHKVKPEEPDDDRITVEEHAGQALVGDGCERVDIDLSPWAGQDIEIQFCLSSDDNERGNGVYLDDVLVFLP